MSCSVLLVWVEIVGAVGLLGATVAVEHARVVAVRSAGAQVGIGLFDLLEDCGQTAVGVP
jgi:hypothetical protein